jgi:hypothetical protein
VGARSLKTFYGRYFLGAVVSLSVCHFKSDPPH